MNKRTPLHLFGAPPPPQLCSRLLRLHLVLMYNHCPEPITRLQPKQEAVCDLLWSLAFNNGLVKEVVGRQGGIALILKGMSSHLSSPELVKSACGALSNMCQNTYNQNLIAAHGGVRWAAEEGTRYGGREGSGEREGASRLAFISSPPSHVDHRVEADGVAWLRRFSAAKFRGLFMFAGPVDDVTESTRFLQRGRPTTLQNGEYVVCNMCRAIQRQRANVKTSPMPLFPFGMCSLKVGEHIARS